MYIIQRNTFIYTDMKNIIKTNEANQIIDYMVT